jgi:hypothetical protein
VEHGLCIFVSQQNGYQGPYHSLHLICVISLVYFSFIFSSFSLQKQKCCFIDKNDTAKRIYDWGTSRIQNMGSRNAIHREDSNSWRHSIRSRTNASKKWRWGGVRIRFWTAATDGDIFHPPWKLPGSEIGFVLNFVATTSPQIPWYSILKQDRKQPVRWGLSQYSVWLRAGRSGDQGSIPDRGERIFPLASVSRPALGPTQPRTMGTGGPFPGGKAWPGRDADQSPPSSVVVENK